MRVQTGLVLLLCLLAGGGCDHGKSTDELIADLKSGAEIEAVKAARTLPRAKDDAAKVVPALIDGLKHSGNDVRRSSALKLGEFHELAKDAIPALQKAEENDRDARVREAAGVALSRIDPEQFPYATKVGSAAAKAVASRRNLASKKKTP
jgi:HEAT repeats